MKRRIIFPPPDYWTQPKENTVTEIFSVNPSSHTIIVGAIESITAIYGRTNGDQTEYVGLYVQDTNIGEVFLPLGFPAAAQVVADISGVLGNHEVLRRRHDEGNQA